MPTYFAGPGGNDGNSGLTWILRKLTLNAVEDVPVIAGDNVYVGPGVYREQLVIDVSGGAGNQITYIGDVTGENTDGIGGIVRITGSDNDQTAARNYCITANAARTHRTFRGFSCDTAIFQLLRGTNSPTDWIVEDCVFQNGVASALVRFTGNAQSDVTVRRCRFIANQSDLLGFSGVGINDAAHLVENCVFAGMARNGFHAVQCDDVGGVTVRNCTFIGPDRAVNVETLTGGAHVACDIENSIIVGCNIGARAVVLGDLTENFNTFHANGTDRSNVNVGANSQTYPPLFVPSILFSGIGQVSGFRFPPPVDGELSEWSQIAAIVGSNEPAEDFLGIARPITASKNSWGAVQFHDVERDTGTTRLGSDASLEIVDAGRVQIKVPIDNNERTFSVYVQRETNYAGAFPQMIIKQPGQADRTTTDTGAVSVFNLLSDTFTPAADPPYVFVELVSNNTAVAGNYAVYFEDLAVTQAVELGSFDEWITDRIPFDLVAPTGGGPSPVPQTTTAVPIACGMLEISTDGCNNWTDISGSSGSLAGLRQARITDQAFSFDQDGAIIVAGQPEPLDLRFNILYTSTAGEAFAIAQTVFEQTGCGAAMCVRWSPEGGNVGDERFQTTDGELISFDYPPMDASAGMPIMTSFVVRAALVSSSVITT